MQPPHDTQRLPAYDPSGHDPADPYAPSGHRPDAQPRRRGGLGRWIALGAVALVVVLIVGLIGLELGLRKNLGDRLQREATASLGSTAHVELGARPVLLSVVDDTLGEVHITTDGAPAEAPNGPAPVVDVTAEGVRSEGDLTHVRSLAGTVFASDAMMSATAREEAGGAGGPLGGLVTVQSVAADPASGTLRVSLGLAEATVTPRIGPGGRLQMDPEQATVLGFPLPDGLLGGTVSMMDSALADLPDGVEITGARVVDGGMVLDIAGRDVVLRPTT